MFRKEKRLSSCIFLLIRESTIPGAPQKNSAKFHSPGLGHMLMGTNHWEEVWAACLPRFILPHKDNDSHPKSGVDKEGEDRDPL